MSAETMTIVLVEDFEQDWMIKHLEETFEVRVRLIKTESEFRGQLDQIDLNPPQAFIIDMILPWTEPAPGQPRAPKDVKAGGKERAGFRCQRLLAERESTRAIPVIFFSRIDALQFEGEIRELPTSAIYVKKADRASLDRELKRRTRLIERVRPGTE